MSIFSYGLWKLLLLSVIKNTAFFIRNSKIKFHIIELFSNNNEINAVFKDNTRTIHGIVLTELPKIVPQFALFFRMNNSQGFKFYIKLHRDGDFPAILIRNSSQYYFKNGLLHREGDLPAVLQRKKTENRKKHILLKQFEKNINFESYFDNNRYYRNGILHRDGDNPAIIYLSGSKKYYKNGLLHREGDLPSIVYQDGDTEYYKNGLLHRDGDLPSINFNFRKAYHKNGLLHRDNFPADIYIIGNEKLYKYYNHGNIHREGGLPAIIYYFSRKEKEKDSYYLPEEYYYESKHLNRKFFGEKSYKFHYFDYYENGRFLSGDFGIDEPTPLEKVSNGICEILHLC